MVMYEGLDERLESKDIDIFKKAFEEEILTTYEFTLKNFKGYSPYKFMTALKTRYEPRYNNLKKAKILSLKIK
ncbi:MAG: hypothetical protein AABW67_03590 [Nanoarchaeota archaeon]